MARPLRSGAAIILAAAVLSGSVGPRLAAASSPPTAYTSYAAGAASAYAVFSAVPLSLAELSLPPPTLGPYFLAGTPSARPGIPRVNYATERFCDIPPVTVTTPTLVGNTAIGDWNLYLLFKHDVRERPWDRADTRGEARYRANFLHLAAWLVRRQVDGAWHWPVPAPCYGIRTAGWISALTQALGVSVLLRAYQLTGDRQDLRVARKAVWYLEAPIWHGGTLGRLGTGFWPQEYVIPHGPPGDAINVLNGGISGLFALWEFAHVTGNAVAARTFRDLARNLADNLADYLFPGWALYDLGDLDQPAPVSYMSLQIRELLVLGRLTGIARFTRVADLWLGEISPARRAASMRRFAAAVAARGLPDRLAW